MTGTMHETRGHQVRRFWCVQCEDGWDVDGYITNGMWDATPDEAVCCPCCGEIGSDDD